MQSLFMRSLMQDNRRRRLCRWLQRAFYTCAAAEKSCCSSTDRNAGGAVEPALVVGLEQCSLQLRQSPRDDRWLSCFPETHTMATPVMTTMTAAMTPRVNTRPSHTFSTTQTKGMISSLAICKGAGNVSLSLLPSPPVHCARLVEAGQGCAGKACQACTAQTGLCVGSPGRSQQDLT